MYCWNGKFDKPKSGFSTEPPLLYSDIKAPLAHADLCLHVTRLLPLPRVEPRSAGAAERLSGAARDRPAPRGEWAPGAGTPSVPSRRNPRPASNGGAAPLGSARPAVCAALPPWGYSRSGGRPGGCAPPPSPPPRRLLPRAAGRAVAAGAGSASARVPFGSVPFPAGAALPMA